MTTDTHINFAQSIAKNPIPGTPPFSEEGLLALLARVPAGCILFDADFRIRFWNPAAERIFGYSQAEMCGMSPTKLIRPSQAEDRFDLILKTARPGETSTFDLENLSKDGDLHICRWQCTPLRLEEAGLTGYLTVVQDITTEKEADEKTRRQLERIRALRAIDMAISGSLDIRLTLNVVLQQALEQLKMDAAIVLAYDPPTGMLKFSCGRGLRTDVLRSASLRIGEGYAGQAALRKQAVKIPDLQHHQKDFPHLPRFHKEGFESYYCVPLVAKGEIKGVMESFHRTSFHPDAEWLDFFETLGGQAAIAIENATLFNDLQRSNMELMLAYDTTLEGWSKALDLRDRDTEGHTQRVVQMTERLAAAVNVGHAVRVHIRRGAMLHDIGKMGIPDSILLKEGPLSEDEWNVMRRHPDLAMEMLAPIAYLRPALDIPYCHHEKWDGSGYSRGLKGEQIPLAARIFAIADVFDALTSNRPYRRAWPVQQALEYIYAQAGKHFDPELAEQFLQVIPNIVP